MITKIHFFDATFDTKTLKFLIDATISNPDSNITEIDLSGCLMGLEGIELMAKALIANPQK